MSDSYEALVDCAATLADAERLAKEVVEVLSSTGLIQQTANADCVLDGAGYPAGPRCAEAYPVDDDGELQGYRFWTLGLSGVQIHTRPWVNVFGFPLFESATCPKCGTEFAEELLEDVGGVVDDYLATGVVPELACPSCQESSRIHDWESDPHLGFASFAIVFWNWPPLADETWKVNVQALLEDRLKRPLVATCGHV